MPKLYTLSDLHLTGTQKTSMSKFGPLWENHEEAIAENWRKLVMPEDIVLLNGDTSWSGKADEALNHLKWISELPGTSYLCEGNHCEDWWRVSKLRKALKEAGITNIKLTTDQDIYELPGGYVLTGTMGWYGPKDKDLFLARNPDDKDRWTNEIYEKTMLRFYQGVIGLRSSLSKIKAQYPDRKILVQTHFPPRNEMFELMKEFNVEFCVYGHLHGDTHNLGTEFVEKDVGNVRFVLASTDYLKHTPLFLADL